MNAKEFYEAFVNATNEQTIVRKEQIESTPDLADGKNTYLDIYRNHEAVYTELINKNIIHNIIKEVEVDEDIISENAEYLSEHPEYKKLVPQHEYFRIDCTGYQHRFFEIDADAAKSIGLNRHFWELKIAVEHENNKHDWMDEVIKLVHVRCPLKVVIGYNYYDQREDGDISKLKFVSDWMQKLAAFDKNAKEEILVIIGNGAPASKNYPAYQTFDYRGYIFNYHAMEFKLIKKTM